jgi:hypothetical protein
MAGFTVEFIRRDNAVRSVPLDEGHTLVIGRCSGADVVFDDLMLLSRLHCRVWAAGGRAWVEPLHCRGEIYINRRAIRGPSEVNEGDEVLLVGDSLRFRLRPMAEPALPTDT